MKTHLAILLVLSLCVCACTAPSSGSADTAGTAGDPKKFMDDVNETLLKLATEASQAGWVSETYITDDTSALNARANQRYIDKVAQYAKDAVRYDKVDEPADLRRALNVLKVSLVLATPSDPKEGEELTKIA